MRWDGVNIRATQHRGTTLSLSSSYKLEPAQVNLVFIQLFTVDNLFFAGVSGLEVALTGRACPVMLSFKPEGLINFGTCNTGSSSTVDLQVHSETALL